MPRCGCQVLWATMAVSRKRVPLELQPCPPTECGALFLVDGAWAYTLEQLAERLAARDGVTLERGRELAGIRYPAYAAHFARCPQADQHRLART